MTPNSGGVFQPVTLTGVGFTGATAVSFGGVLVLFTVVNDTTITTTSPVLIGTVTIQVLNLSGAGNGLPYAYV